MNNIQVFAKWKVKETSLDEVLELLKEVSEKSRSEEGNISYEVNQSTTDRNTLLLHERYINNEAIEVHRNTDHFQQLVLGKIVPLLEEREVVIAKRLY